MPLQIKKATRQSKKVKIALIGIAGSGKTYSALAIAKGLGSKVLCVDTEHGSASAYADFGFDTIELDSFAPQTYVEAIHMAEEQGYDVVILDSLSHAWTGKDGALEQVDKAARRSGNGNSFNAWRDVTPQHNEMIEAIVGAKCHLIATLRAKTDYVVEQGRNGKSAPRKVGLAPVQRDGLEYEFDLVGTIDQDHQCVITKSRIPALTDAVIDRPGAEVAKTLHEWLAGGATVAEGAVEAEVMEEPPKPVAYLSNGEVVYWHEKYLKALHGTPAASEAGADRWVSSLTKNAHPTLLDFLTTKGSGHVEALFERAQRYGETKRAELAGNAPAPIVEAVRAKVEASKESDPEGEALFDGEPESEPEAQTDAPANQRTDAQYRALLALGKRRFGAKESAVRLVERAGKSLDALSVAEASVLIDQLRAEIADLPEKKPSEEVEKAYTGLMAEISKAGLSMDESQRDARIAAFNEWAKADGIYDDGEIVHVESFTDLRRMAPGASLTAKTAVRNGVLKW